MKGYLVFAVVVSALLISGCTSEKTDAAIVANPTVITSVETPIPAMSMVPTPVVKQIGESNEDRKFLDAAEVCYKDTPVIANLSTHLAFVMCMQKTPEPTTDCARNYKHNALKYTNDDDTSSGYKRETHNTRLFREAFYKNLTYNPVRQMFEPCT